MKKSIIPILTVICFIPTVNITASAEEIPNQQGISAYSAGLIYNYGLSITNSEKAIMLTAKTNCNSSMKYLGLKNIVVQKSSNNVTWSDCITLADMLNENSSLYAIYDKQVATVTGGYYYRITCNHYAKESGLFGSSESISNSSNSVFIS
ncbi:MAG: hypothetical protein ACI4KF_02420 [Huintestinicola sp.]